MRMILGFLDMVNQPGYFQVNSCFKNRNSQGKASYQLCWKFIHKFISSPLPFTQFLKAPVFQKVLMKENPESLCQITHESRDLTIESSRALIYTPTLFSPIAGVGGGAVKIL